MQNQNEDRIFPLGKAAPADRFTGAAFINPLVPGNKEPYYCSISDVVFKAGSRNNWHVHQSGQVLLVTAGKGFYQEKGKKAQPLGKGDVVPVPADVEHWHGAAPDCDMTHISINFNLNKGDAVWLGPVTDEEYRKATAGN